MSIMGATGAGIEWLRVNQILGQPGVITGTDVQWFASQFIEAVAAGRFWYRELV